MTVEQLVKDGQLQVDSLKAVLEDAALDKAGVVLVADGEHTMALHSVGDCATGTWGSLMWPMVGSALAELLKRAKDHDAEAWAVIARYFVLSQQEEVVKAVRVKAEDFGALLAALNGKETEDEQQD